MITLVLLLALAIYIGGIPGVIVGAVALFIGLCD